MPFKIINVTNNLSPRSAHFNQSVNVDTGNGQSSIPPGGSIVIDNTIIPITVRKLQLEGRIKLDHLTNKETRELQKLPPPIQTPPKETPVVKVESKKTTIKKKTTKPKTTKKKKTS